MRATRYARGDVAPVFTITTSQRHASAITRARYNIAMRTRRKDAPLLYAMSMRDCVYASRHARRCRRSYYRRYDAADFAAVTRHAQPCRCRYHIIRITMSYYAQVLIIMLLCAKEREMASAFDDAMLRLPRDATPPCHADAECYATPFALPSRLLAATLYLIRVTLPPPRR